MKKGVILGFVVIVLLSFVAFNSRNINNNDSSTEKVSASLSISKKYEDIDMLKTEAEAVIEVEVLSNDTVMFRNEPYTNSKVRILDSFKGSLEIGEEIYITETGGVYSTNKESKKNIEVTMEGIPVIKPGEKYILFIKRFHGPQIEDAYTTLGVYQGKFKIKDKDLVEQTAPSDGKVKDFKKDIKKNEFKSLLK